MDEPVEVSQEWISDAETLLTAHREEAEGLRAPGFLPSPSDGSDVVLERLSLVRARMDRVETLLAEIAVFRAGARRLFKEASARVDDKWSERVANSTGARRQTFGEQIEGPRERYARADVAVAGERIAARRRERVLDSAQDAFDAVDRVRRGLDSYRHDLHAVLRLFVAEHRLDRTDST